MSKKTKNSLIVPERRIMMSDGTMMLFRADHRAWYTLERHTGLPLMSFLQGLGEAPPMSAIYYLAWALSATGRFREQRSEDFEGFLDLLPPLGAMSTVMQPLMEMVGEAFRPANEVAQGNE